MVSSARLVTDSRVLLERGGALDIPADESVVEVAASGECKRRNFGKRAKASGQEREEGSERTEIKSSVEFHWSE